MDNHQAKAEAYGEVIEIAERWLDKSFILYGISCAAMIIAALLQSGILCVLSVLSLGIGAGGIYICTNLHHEMLDKRSDAWRQHDEAFHRVMEAYDAD